MGTSTSVTGAREARAGAVGALGARLRMPEGVRTAYRAERRQAISAEAAGDVEGAWAHLERAHVLAQPFVVAHTGSHVAQLGLAVRRRDRTEVAGQVVRVLVAGPASLVGRIPTGNDGRARTPLRATAPVPPDLAAVLGPTAG
jgi:hypothetical protein